MKNKTSKAFQRTLLALTGKEKTFIKMMNDGKYMMQAHEFVQDRLRDITSDAVKKGVAGMEREMGILLKSDKILKMYDQNPGI